MIDSITNEEMANFTHEDKIPTEPKARTRIWLRMGHVSSSISDLDGFDIRTNEA